MSINNHCLICEKVFMFTLSLLVVTFSNSLEPDQVRQNVGPDLDLNYLSLIVLLKEFFEKANFEKRQQMTSKSLKNYLTCK